MINKLPQSADGKYYVDADVCLICNCCVEEAPNNFKYDKEEKCSYVYKQPTTTEEVKLCEDALNCCPVEAIGNDGDLID